MKKSLENSVLTHGISVGVVNGVSTDTFGTFSTWFYVIVYQSRYQIFLEYSSKIAYTGDYTRGRWNFG